MSSTHEVAGHRLTLLHNGEEYFAHLLAAIQSASSSIYFETYIFSADACGKSFKDAFKNAAVRGVAVHVLLDGFGSEELPAAWIAEMSAAGVQILWFRPELSKFRMWRQRLRRLHRKLVLIDEHVAFIGGINILEETHPPRLDYAVEVRGETVAAITYSMHRLWLLVSWATFKRGGMRVNFLQPPKQGQQEVGLLIRDNLRHRRDIENAYLRAILNAQHEIIIANAYFLPGRRFRRTLLHAAQRGVRVVLLLQGKVEYRLQHYATLALYEELLQAGVEIHEYTYSFLHAKVAVVDSQWATVGSSNIDPFSLWLAREANLEVKNSDFAVALRESLLEEIRYRAGAVSRSEWQERTLVHRLVLRGSYSLMKILVSITGYTNKQDDI